MQLNKTPCQNCLHRYLDKLILFNTLPMMYAYAMTCLQSLAHGKIREITFAIHNTLRESFWRITGTFKRYTRRAHNMDKSCSDL